MATLGSVDPTTQSLLPNPELPGVLLITDAQRSGILLLVPSSVSPLDLLAAKKVAESRNMLLIALILLIVAISKATGPLFTTCIQRRYGVFAYPSSSQVK